MTLTPAEEARRRVLRFAIKFTAALLEATDGAGQVAVAAQHRDDFDELVIDAAAKLLIERAEREGGES